MDSLDMYTEDQIRGWMKLSIELEKKSLSEPGTTKPKVGVVIVRDGVVLGHSFRGETGEGRHAEFGLVEKLGKENLEGATIFTTLEPCSRRNFPKMPCAQQLIDAKVAVVYIGMYDSNPLIYREGWSMLRDAGITIRDYRADLRQEIMADNKLFIDTFRLAVGERGSASFDYSQNGGKFILKHDEMEINTTWTARGRDTIYAVDHAAHVALARHAHEFSEIDDPGALDWSNYTVAVDADEIVAFRNSNAYGLVKIKKVFAGSSRGDDHTSLHFEYELRRKQ
jgi:diaminohydroxyphosphoribosylaminopyrimidine deaminase/5-amino-6-(5-phosphoribosylamino)uracil reductase